MSDRSVADAAAQADPVHAQTPGTDPWREAALVIAAAAALAVAATWPLAAHLRTHLPSDAGDPALNTWILAWDAARLRHGIDRLWNAPNFFPYNHTLLYSEHLLGLAVFTAPIQWMTGNPVLTYNVAYIASWAFSACGMYVLARSLTGRIDAAAIAAAAYAFTPFRMAHLSHIQWLTIGWLPLAVWASIRYFRSGALRHALAAAFFFYMQAMTASYFMYFALLPLAAVGLAEWRHAPVPARRLVRDLAVALVLLAAAIAPIAAAYYSVRHDLGLRRSLEDIVAYSADISNYVRASHDLRLWRVLPPGGSDRELFPGLLVTILALVAATTLWRRERTVRTFVIVAALAFLFSLGPQPSAWGHVLPFPGPYRLLLAVIPGLNGLRAPGRLAVVLVLALGALAAFGASLLLHRASPRVRRPLAIVIAALCVAEGWIAPMRLVAFDPAGAPRDRAAYEYLRTSPRGGVLELPIAIDEPTREARYEYMTLVHEHPVVNGHSGYTSPLFVYLAGGHSPLRELDHLDAALAMLSALNVRYVVAHRGDGNGDAMAAALLRTAAEHPERVTTTRDFGSSVVVTIPYVPLPPAPADATRVPRSAIQATASAGTDRLAQAFDGDPDSRWLSGNPQSGNEWVQLSVDHPRNIALVRMTLAERSFGDYPRHLAVDVVEDTGVRTVFDGPVLPQFAQGLFANPVFPAIDIVLPPNRGSAVRLRQTGTANQFFWSIHELQIFER